MGTKKSRRMNKVGWLLICMYHDAIESWVFALAAQKYLTKQTTAALVRANTMPKAIK